MFLYSCSQHLLQLLYIIRAEFEVDIQRFELVFNNFRKKKQIIKDLNVRGELL